jgi:hypothetical protein
VLRSRFAVSPSAAIKLTQWVRVTGGAAPGHAHEAPTRQG